MFDMSRLQRRNAFVVRSMEGLGRFFTKKPFVYKQITPREAAKDDLMNTLQLLNRSADRRYSNVRREFDRTPIDSGTDAREGDCAYGVGRGELKRTTVARSQELWLPMRPAPPNRTNGVDDDLRGKAAAPCELGIASLAPPEQATLLYEVRPGGPVNCSVYAAASKQRGVRSIDDCVNCEGRDVRLKRAK
jgi:hypothetical protein